MKYLIIIILSFCSINECNSQYGWQWQNPKPTGSNLYSIQFTSSLTGFAASQFGIIYKTTDGGISWINIETGLPYSINTIFVKDANTIYASLSNNVLLSSNGGYNWITLPVNTNNNINCIYFYNDLTGYTVGEASTIRKTTNGGLNWFSQNLLFYYNLNSICFADSLCGVIASYGKILRTSNAGNDWDTIPYTFYPYTQLNSVIFTDHNTGYVVGESAGVLKTTNKGLEWTKIDSSSNPIAITFINTQTGYAAGQSTIIKTTNAGNSWTPNYGGNYLRGISLPDINTGYVCGAWGNILKTTNAGNNWNYLSYSNPTLDCYCVWFTDLNTGYVGTSNGSVYKTSNGGNNWNFLNTSSNGVNYIYFLNHNTGFKAGNGIAKTTNGGINWILAGTSSEVYSIYFPNSFTGYASGYNSTFKTTNTGISWFSQLSFTGYMNSIFFTDVNTGYTVGAYGNSGFIYKTTNGGDNWSLLSLPINSTCNCVHFPNSNTGYISTSQGRIFKTTNTGANWIYQQSPTFNNLYNVYFFDMNTGYASGMYGAVVRTTNGGTNWYLLKQVTDNYLWAMYFFNLNTGYVVGKNGTILKTTTGGVLLGNKSISIQTNVPKNFSLSQNYPNPFNPSTKIRFDIPPLSSIGEGPGVRLVIYDVLGREVTTLVNEQLKPGTYEIAWDASNYASGMYFYKLITDEYVQTKKMVLIK